MTSREKFEEWWERFYEDTPMEPWDELYSPENDFYFDQIIDGQYDAWKASRDEEIGLPGKKEPVATANSAAEVLVMGKALGFNECLSQTADAIRAAGFKVRGG